MKARNHNHPCQPGELWKYIGITARPLLQRPRISSAVIGPPHLRFTKQVYIGPGDHFLILEVQPRAFTFIRVMNALTCLCGWMYTGSPQTKEKASVRLSRLIVRAIPNENNP